LRLEPADPTEGGSRCFTWNAAAVPLAVPLGDDERARGTNPVRVMTHEAPAGIGSFGGRFHAVCLEARYLGPTFLAPASGERRDVNPRHFRELADHGLEDCLPVEVDASRPPEGG
jgi:hypothetical protein